MSSLTPPNHSSSAADASTPHGRSLPSGPTTSSTQPLCGPLAGMNRHPEFWLDDGNLILVAGRETAFRIYTGLLASQSEVFANMFTVASSSADEAYEGCPVVPVYDTPVEFAHLLRVLIPKETRT
uniref:Fungal_trans domain-containing protein n=1 Tax=Ganoderma boninense TaxID=34458 RepID=A0A5K1K0Y1_9APHY|nr:Fungal_trans domain-containing protein [Ganoderma boninense]